MSFEIINKKCAIKAHVYDQTTKKTEFLNYIKKLLIPKYKDFKTKNYRRIGKSMLVIEFIDFIVLENGNIDFEKTKQKLLRIKEVFDKTINIAG